MKKISDIANVTFGPETTDFDFKYIDGTRGRFRAKNRQLQEFFLSAGANGAIQANETPRAVGVFRSNVSEHVVLKIQYSKSEVALLMSNRMAQEILNNLMFALAPRA